MSRKVLLVISGDMYGLSRTALDAAAPLLSSGAGDVELWSSSDGPLLAVAESQGLRTRVVPLPVLRRAELRGTRAISSLAGLVADAIRLWWQVRRKSRDVELVHALGAPNLGGLVVAWASRSPLVWSVHEVFGSRVETRVFRSLLRLATARVACSRYVADQFGPLSDSFVVVPSGTDVEEEGAPLLGPPPHTIICVGRLNRWKGQDVLLRAYAGLPEDVRRATRLHLVGSSYEGDPTVDQELKVLAHELGIEHQVTFFGERDDARSLMARSDIVVVPSKRPEPFGKVVIEGMALGRAVIATRPGGPAEVITHGKDGLLVPLDDAAAITGSLLRLLRSHESARALGREAQTTAARFTADAAAAGYGTAYGLANARRL